MVVPLSVVSSWMLELSRWAPQLRVVRFHTNDVDERKRLRQEVRVWSMHASFRLLVPCQDGRYIMYGWEEH